MTFKKLNCMWFCFFKCIFSHIQTCTSSTTTETMVSMAWTCSVVTQSFGLTMRFWGSVRLLQGSVMQFTRMKRENKWLLMFMISHLELRGWPLKSKFKYVVKCGKRPRSIVVSMALFQSVGPGPIPGADIRDFLFFVKLKIVNNIRFMMS